VSTPTARFEGTPVSEAAALACAAIFGGLAGSYLWIDDASTQVRLLIGLPIAASILAVSFRKRELVWTALGLCLGSGLIGFFSVGLSLLPMGLAIFTWWVFVSRRAGQPVVVGDDLPFEAAGFALAMVIVFGFPLG
jgi:hypothetical protein